MKQIFRSNIGMITREVPIPIPDVKEVLVKVNYSLISTGTETSALKPKNKSFFEKISESKKALDKATDLIASQGLKPTWEIIQNKLSPSEKSLILNPIGYSNSGVVVAKGSGVTNINVGDRVACAGSGIAAHSEFVTIPINLVARIHDSLSFDKASFTTVGSIALQGLRRANLQFGETVTIVGLGLLGLLAVQMAKAYGLIVIGIDLKQTRVDLAKKLGADYCLLANDPKLEDKVKQITNGIGVDASIIYAGTSSSQPANQSLRIARRKGRVVVVGAVGMDLERGAMYEKELDFVISTSYGPGRYDDEYEFKGKDYPIGYVRWTENRNMQEVIRLLAEEKIKTDLLINKVFSVEESAEAYNYLLIPDQDNIAVLFSYENLPNRDLKTRKFEIDIKNISKNKIKVGVIGGGGFASRTHIPNLLKLSQHYELIAIANKTPSKAKMIGNSFNPKYVTTNYQEILDDSEIDLVIITTRHNLHGKITIEALKSGKHVLVEKPLTMNFGELDKIKDALLESKKYLAVGFNRRYSELSLKVKEIIKNNNETPVFVNYRINAGYIPLTHWTQDPLEGGGRIIGEVCHFIDLCNDFVNDKIKDFNISHIPVDGKLINSEDNIVITITYQNGSLAVISYVSIGASDLPKERVEVFSNKSCMVIDDFQSLAMFGTNKPSIKLNSVDKGQLKELDEFAKKIKGEKTLLPSIEQDILATEITLGIMELLRGNTING